MQHKVRDIMTKKVEMISSDVPIQTAAKTMNKRDIGFLPVHDGGQAVGTLTDRDIALRAVGAGQHSSKVSEVMSPGIHTVRADADVTEAAVQMREHDVQRLVVIDETDSLRGIVSLSDLAACEASGDLPGGTIAALCTNA